MDEGRPTYRMQAPGASGSAESWRLPDRDFPRVDDHLDEPEVTRWERVGGRRLKASPAQRDHAVQHVRLDRVIDSYVAEGYEAASDLKTRVDEDSDFASDTAILKAGIDPKTGTRYLEDVAFEVVAEQGPGDAKQKARRMTRRGVKRVFAVFVKKRQVAEWSAEEDDWMTLHTSSSIEDECLVAPIAIKALLDAAEADDAVASALVTKGNPVIREVESRSKAEGKAEAILDVLAARGLSVSEEQREGILSTTEPDVLRRWIARVALVASADELLDAG